MHMATLSPRFLLLLLAERFNQLTTRATYNYVSFHSGHVLPGFLILIETKHSSLYGGELPQGKSV